MGEGAVPAPLYPLCRSQALIPRRESAPITPSASMPGVLGHRTEEAPRGHREDVGGGSGTAVMPWCPPHAWPPTSKSTSRDTLLWVRSPGPGPRCFRKRGFQPLPRDLLTGWGGGGPLTGERTPAAMKARQL